MLCSIIIILLLQTGWAKNIIRNKLQAYISQKTNTEFRIGAIDYSLPVWVELDDVFMRDIHFGQRLVIKYKLH